MTGLVKFLVASRLRRTNVRKICLKFTKPVTAFRLSNTHHGTAVEAHEVVDCEDDVEDLPARDEAVPVEVVQRERPPQALVRRPAKERRQGDQHVLQARAKAA